MIHNTLGWREWVSLPDLGVSRIKAKVDTGARTSALHAIDIHIIDGIAHFKIQPTQRDFTKTIQCQAPLIDQREVKDSGGHTENRYVIETSIIVGETKHLTEMTLTNRDNMGFRMLIGRKTMEGLYVVDPGKEYLMGKRKNHA